MLEFPDNVDLAKEKAVVRCYKTATVQARFANADGLLETLEGAVPYTKGDAILTGVEGEQWPVVREKFFQKYDPVPPCVGGEAGTYAKKRLLVYAKQMQTPFSVRLKAVGALLAGKPGDWLVQYAVGDYGIVSDDIFQKTYQVLS